MSTTVAHVARRMRPWLWAGVALMAVALFVITQRRPQGGAAANHGTLDPDIARAIASMTIPDFQLIDQSGNVVVKEIFSGRWTILDFGFSYCTMACPVLKQNLAAAMADLEDSPVRAVTISVDPVHDTPLRLREYAKEMEMDLNRWSLLTEAGGDSGQVRKIAVESLGFLMQDDPENQIRKPDGTTMNNILHPTRFLVIGPDIRVRGMYRGNEPGEVRQMVLDLRAWMTKEPPSATAQ